MAFKDISQSVLDKVTQKVLNFQDNQQTLSYRKVCKGWKAIIDSSITQINPQFVDINLHKIFQSIFQSLEIVDFSDQQDWKCNGSNISYTPKTINFDDFVCLAKLPQLREINLGKYFEWESLQKWFNQNTTKYIYVSIDIYDPDQAEMFSFLNGLNNEAMGQLTIRCYDEADIQMHTLLTSAFRFVHPQFVVCVVCQTMDLQSTSRIIRQGILSPNFQLRIVCLLYDDFLKRSDVDCFMSCPFTKVDRIIVNNNSMQSFLFYRKLLTLFRQDTLGYAGLATCFDIVKNQDLIISTNSQFREEFLEFIKPDVVKLSCSLLNLKFFAKLPNVTELHLCSPSPLDGFLKLPTSFCISLSRLCLLIHTPLFMLQT
eukprot:TRINITY_DN5650_c0_g1_i1.p2 TRINITY_DN5650_c0_g1~~TRINITY_DN5650_c0_g1_i1.p2  ORF type:complete len:371 (-),score=-6.07 TRINITY_DN5650_c0_g1_i1:386-1498(-)